MLENSFSFISQLSDQPIAGIIGGLRLPDCYPSNCFPGYRPMQYFLLFFMFSFLLFKAYPLASEGRTQKKQHGPYKFEPGH